jgi:UDP-glucose 4-epimerase
VRVFVTGGTGFIGSHLVDRLLERGDDVYALVRSPQKAVDLPERGVALIRGDLDDTEALARGVAGAEVVYHVAGLVGLKGQRNDVMRVNVEGTNRLLQASIAAGVRRFVFVSSVGVYGMSSAPRPIAEDAPLEGLFAWYDRSGYYTSKVLAEAVVRHTARQHGLEFSIVRPALVYGERDAITQHSVRLALRLPLAPLPWGGRVPIDLVHGLDVADAILLAGICPAAAGETFNVGAGEMATLREAFTLVRQAAGRPARIVSVTAPLGPLGRRLRAGLVYDIHKAQALLGYRPQIRLRDGLPRVVAALLA